MLRLRCRLGALVLLILTGGKSGGALYEVGPGRSYQTLQEVTNLLQAGDVVTVDGGATYPGGVKLDGTGAAGRGVITVRGLRVNGERPVLSGVTEQGQAVMRVRGSHYVIEGFDLTAGGDSKAARCFYNVGDDVTLRDSVVHDCKFTGISGSDVSGSLTLDRVEVCRCGQGLYAHQIYVGSSLATYPRALFRMQYCYVHDGTGGNNVKSRVTRNEIEYNWIEGAAFHELDLVGPDPKSQGTPAEGVHCDADVVGNVLVVGSTSQGTVARLGSDGTGASRGRCRFAYNTVIVRAQQAAKFGLFWLEGEVDSVGMWNNVFWSEAGPLDMVRQEKGATPKLAGGGNWVRKGAAHMPAAWKAILGEEPGFLDVAAENYRPGAGSTLIGAGCEAPGEVVATGVPPDPESGWEGGRRDRGRDRDIGAFPGAAGGDRVGN